MDFVTTYWLVYLKLGVVLVVTTYLTHKMCVNQLREPQSMQRIFAKKSVKVNDFSLEVLSCQQVYINPEI